ncbi:UNVERIFIED_CONTAM: hypothetical protein Sradi_4454100 [Sesamum radiatum]|uniref:Uncharacterized protein n=1 Tax=Sesamum radiatum TaxID=300843 RepID=A0AAW2NS63_SESRA
MAEWLKPLFLNLLAWVQDPTDAALFAYSKLGLTRGNGGASWARAGCWCREPRLGEWGGVRLLLLIQLEGQSVQRSSSRPRADS